VFDSAKHWQTLAFAVLFFLVNILALNLTFGGMGLLPCVAVARVFAIEVRCRIMLLFVYCRVGKNRDTRRETLAAAEAACAASHNTVLFNQKFLAAQKAMTYTDLLGAGNYCEHHWI